MVSTPTRVFSSLINLPRWDADRIDTIDNSYILNGTPDFWTVGLWNWVWNNQSVYHSGINQLTSTTSHLSQILKNSFFSSYGSVIFNIFLFFNWGSNHKSIEEYQSTLDFILHVWSYLWLYHCSVVIVSGTQGFRSGLLNKQYDDSSNNFEITLSWFDLFWTTLLTSFERSWLQLKLSLRLLVCHSDPPIFRYFLALSFSYSVLSFLNLLYLSVSCSRVVLIFLIPSSSQVFSLCPYREYKRKV